MKHVRVLLLGIILAAARAAADDYQISVDAGSDLGPLSRFWQRSVGSCHIGMVNGSHYRDPDTSIALNHRKAYLLAAKELGMQGVRAHGILMDDVGIYHEDYQGNPVYAWERFDELMDFIVGECGMKPIVELSYMPIDLAADPSANYAFWYGGNASIPKDYNKWKDLIKSVVQHCVTRYGKSTVDQWRWEVYNEPNLSYPGGWEEYSKLYDYAVEGAVQADPDVKIGGSAMDASGVDGYFYHFLDHCRSGTNHANGGVGTRINFFSHHAYPDNFGSVGDARYYRQRHNFFTSEIAKYYSALNLEQLITETGSSFFVFGHNDGFYESHDTGQSGSFVAQSVQTLLYNTTPPPAAWSYWVISDLWEEGFQRPGDKLSYYGIMGMTLRKDNIFKPVFHVFKMLSMLGDRLLSVTGGSSRDDYKGANAVATKSADGNQVQVVVFNQDYYNGLSHPDDTLADNVGLTVANLPAGWSRAHIQVFGVDKYRSNTYSDWVKAGSPEYPTDATWDAMKRDQHLASLKEPFVVAISSGRSFTDSLPAYRTGVYMYVLTNPDATPAKKCDLTVTDITWTPKRPTPGTPVVFSAVVKNQGALGSPTATHHGVAFYVNGVKTTWSATRSSSIPPGASAVLTASVGVNGAAWTAAEGTFRVSAEVDDVGIIPEEREDNNTLTRTLEAGAAVALPSGWHNADIGNPAARGAAGLHGGDYYVTGSGSDLGEAFHFAFKRGSGNAIVSARVESLENTSVTGWEKAGVMFRESEKSNSKFAALVVTRTHGVVFFWRSVNGGNVSYRLSSPPGFGSAPIHLKLTRQGKSLSAFYSSDGVTWISMTGANIPLPTDIVSGLCVTSVADGVLNKAKFTNVTNTFDRAEGDPHGLLAHYYKGIDANFANNVYRLERIDPNVNFNWENGAPDPLLGPDLFSIVWRGYVTPPSAGTYTFYTQTDDGVQLWVNGIKLVDKWIDQGTTEYAGTVALPSGPVPIEMRYYDRGLGAAASLLWSGPGLAKQVVPSNRLSPGLPDLVVTDVSATPTNPVAGDELSFSATVRNVGSTGSPDGALHAVAFYVDGRKVTWSTSRFATLAPGASAVVTADGGVNGDRWTAEVGAHDLMAFVDDNDTITETDEFNNRTTVPLSVAAAAQAGRGLYGRYYNNIDFTDLRLARVDPKVKFNWFHLAPDLSMGADAFSIRWTGAVTPRFGETYTFYTDTDDGVRLWVDGQLIVDQWSQQGRAEHTGTIALRGDRPVTIRMDYFDAGTDAVANLAWSSASQAKEFIPRDQLYPNGYEAEAGEVGGGAVAMDSFVGQMHNVGAWNRVGGVDGLAGGTRALEIRYATNETGVTKSLYVNNVFVRRVTFPPTGGWGVFASTTVAVSLDAGTGNTVKLQNDGSDAGGVNIDSFLVGDALPSNAYEAEAGTVGGGAVVSGSYVGQMHVGGAWNQITGVDGLGGGARGLEIKYATNEAGVTKSLFINGAFVRRVSFPMTGGWETFGTVQVPVVLNPTANTVKLLNDAGDVGGVNIDRYAVSTTAPLGIYEAESGEVGGGAAINGTYVGQMHVGGAWNQIGGVDGVGGGARVLDIRYATNEAGVTKSLFINGAFVRRLSFPVTGGWESFGTVQATVALNATGNTVKVLNDAGDVGGVNIDRYVVSTAVPTGLYEAEAGTVGGGAAVNGTYVGQLHVGGAWSQVGGVDGLGGGARVLELRYATNEAGVTKSLFINGAFVRRMSFPATGGWESFATVQAPVVLNATGNTVKVLNDAGDVGGLNIDRYGVLVSSATGVYEAELGTLGGGAAITGPAMDGESVLGYHGYYVGQMQNNGAWNQVEGIDGRGGGAKILVIRCAASLTNGRKYLYVNGILSQTIIIPPAWYGWTSFHDMEVPITLNPGTANVVRILNQNAGDGGLNIDRYTVKEPTP